jgi:hypothetical protein
MDRGDLGLLLFSQIKPAKRAATSPARAPGTTRPTRTAEASLTSAARSAPAHRALLWGSAPLGSAIEFRTAASLLTSGLRVLSALRLRRGHCADHGNDGDANDGKYAFHSYLLCGGVDNRPPCKM